MNERKESEITSLVLVGVGGQGILLASEIIARTVMASGLDVKMNEIHGMAQRGGSVVAQIRFGRSVAGPLVPRGTAKVLVSLERTEILRYVDYLAPEALAVVSDQVIVPVTASSGQTAYPEVSESDMRKIVPNLVWVHASAMAEELGNAKAANSVLLGALSNELEFPAEDWLASIRGCVKPKYAEMNVRAFHLGRELKRG